MTLKKFQTSAEFIEDSGLYLIRDPGPPVLPSKTGSTWTTGTSVRVSGDWSLRWPVIQALRVLSCLRSGLTCGH